MTAPKSEVSEDFEATTLSLKRLKEQLDSQSLTIRKQEQDLKQAREEIEVLKAKLNKTIEHFKDLVKDCQWYADKGTEQERHHFLMVETQGNYLDLAINDINAITIDSIKRGENENA